MPADASKPVFSDLAIVVKEDEYHGYILVGFTDWEKAEKYAEKYGGEVEVVIEPADEEFKLPEVCFDPSGLKLGVYRIFWKSGGCSPASVGHDSAGKYWMAPANWINGFTFDWSDVERVELIEAYKNTMR